MKPFTRFRGGATCGVAQSDRRCYAFFHPALPQEPLIFIEVALTRAVTAQVQPLLDPESPVDDPAQATCAIFYSITNCQQGLRVVSFGNVLIKQVVEDIGKEFRASGHLRRSRRFQGFVRSSRNGRRPRRARCHPRWRRSTRRVTTSPLQTSPPCLARCARK
jgi:hypothetical protein